MFHGILKGTVFWRTLSKRSQNAQPQNEILCSEGAWGRCPQQADGRKCECVFTLALLAGSAPTENALEIKGLRVLEVWPHSGQPAR